MIYVAGHGSGFYNQGGSPSSTRILLCLSADVFTGWLRAMCLMDNRGPFQKYVRLDWTNIRWLYLACGTDFYQRSYVLCQIQMSVATKHRFLNVLLSKMFVSISEVVRGSLTEPRAES